MRSMIGLLVVVVIVVIAYRVYFSQLEPAGTRGAPAQAISATSAKNDILAIAQAERSYIAEHGSYASLDELTSSGAMTMLKSERGGYRYSIETSSGGFTVIARCLPTAGPSCTSFAVDQTMEVHTLR